MSYSLDEIKGMEAAHAEALRAQGVTNSEVLLERAKTPRDRKALADATGIDGALILEFANRCDLMRVKGVGRQYADLLEETGVDTVPELAQRNAGNLAKAMAELNDAKKLVSVVPTEAQVTGWVTQAKDLGRMLEY